MNYRQPTSATREIAPCKGCTDRYIACHDNCQRYQAWKAEVYEVQQKRNEFNRKNGRKEWDLRRS